jgi:hypothetical protein
VDIVHVLMQQADCQAARSYCKVLKNRELADPAISAQEGRIISIISIVTTTCGSADCPE